MNTPSPLIPLGATPPRGKSSLYFKVLIVVTVHVVLIGGMLLQGCKDNTSKDLTNNNSQTPNPADTMPMATNPAPASNPVAPMGEIPPTLNPNISNTMAGTALPPTPGLQPLPQPAPAPAPTGPEAAPLPAAGEKEYVIVQGDRMAAIAHRNGISLKALMDANPGVNPKKLKVGQKLQIPANLAVGTVAGAGTESTAAEGEVYTVKSGDMLLRIAKAHGTTVKKIMALNDLKTTSIRAGQKLKLPAARAASSEPAGAPAAAAMPVPTAPVMKVSAAPSPVSSN
jgi:LysM repeat protein